MTQPTLSAALLALTAFLAAPTFAEDAPEARAYDIASLTRAESHPAPHLGLARSQPDGGTLSFDDADDDADRLTLSTEALYRFLIQEMAQAGVPRPGQFDARGGILRVLAPKSTHTHLAASLTRLRAQLGRTATLEVRLVALTPAQAAAMGVAGGPLGKKQRDLLAKGKPFATVRLVARHRETVSGALLSRSTFLGDFEVNQTGTIPVLNPVIEELLEGVVAEVTCRLPRVAGGHALLDCRVEGARRFGAQASIPFGPGGIIDLPVVDHLAFGGSLRLRVGEVALLGAVRSDGVDGKPRVVAALVTLRAVTAQPQADPKALSLRAYDLSGLAGPRSFRFDRPTWPSDTGSSSSMTFRDPDDAPSAPLGKVAVRELVLNHVSPKSWASGQGKRVGSWVEVVSGGLAVAQSAEGHQRLAAFLQGLLPTPSALRYELIVVQTSKLLSATATLSSQECEAILGSGTVRSRATIGGLSGQTVELLSRHERRFLADIERSSGGGVASTVQVDDPIMGTLAAGLSLRLSGSVTGARITLAADLDLRGPATLRATHTTWGVVELYTATHRRVQREASLASGEGVVLAVQPGKTPEVYLLRVWQ
ncbi:MAG: hypothetical protein JKY65_24690 [Planctomycetes bacterium]|nr:hypothetical protein [Planctomycetota bacterium]